MALGAAAALPKPVEYLAPRNEATETAFIEVDQSSIIHLAVHAIANDTIGSSRFCFSQDPQHGEDGFLYLRKSSAPIDADLVVLSACDTAVGPVEGEEDFHTRSCFPPSRNSHRHIHALDH